MESINNIKFIPSLNFLIMNNYITFENNQKLNRASFGQIMATIANVSINKKDLKPYEYYMKGWFNKNIPILILEYLKLLTWLSDKQWWVLYFNLIGNLPNKIHIYQEKHNIMLKGANLGYLIEALKNRVNFIITRKIPIMYLNDQEYLTFFNNLRELLKIFLQKIIIFEQEFVNAIDNAHHIYN
jgi:hypothetical protein